MADRQTKARRARSLVLGSGFPRPGWFPTLLLALAISAAFPSAPCAQEASRSDVVLENGLRVRLRALPGSRLVASNVFVGAGSTRESDATAGSSHFLEHLLFNGTTSRTQEQLYDDVDRIGAYNNATTKREYTHFMMVAPSEHLSRALELQADMLLHSTLPPEKFEKERGIILEELSKDRDNPSYATEGTLERLLFGEGHFSRPVLGTHDTLQNLRHEVVRDYYRRQYVPENMLVVLIGDFDPATALDLLQQHFRSAGPADAAPVSPPAATLPDESRLLSETIDGDANVVRIILPIPGPGHADHGTLVLLSHIVGITAGNRIESALAASPRIEARSVGASLQYLEDLCLLEIRVSTDPDVAPDAVVRRVWGEITGLGEGITRTELAGARTQVSSQEIRQLEQLHYYALFKGDRIWHSDADFVTRLLEAVETATPEGAAEVARRHWTRPIVHVSAVGPELEARSEALALAPESSWSRRREATASPASPEHPGVTVGDGSVVQQGGPGPSPALGSPEPPSLVTLDNGLQVLHVGKPSTRMFALHLLVKNRSAREPEDRPGMADLLHRLLPRGAGDLDREAWAAQIDAIGAELKLVDNPWIPYDDYYTTPLYSFVRMDCTDEHFSRAIHLLGTMVQSPRCPSDEIPGARAEMTAAAQRDAGRSSHRVAQRFAKLLYGDHPLARRPLGDPGSLSDVDAAELRRFAAEYLAPEHLLLAAVGNVSRDAVLHSLSSNLGDPNWRGGSGGTEVPPLPAITETSVEETLESDGEQSALRMGRVVEVEAGDLAALQVAGMIRSSRMQQDLRETRGLAYSLGIRISTLGSRATIEARMATRPENVDEARAGMREHLVSAELVTDEAEIEGVVNRFLGRTRMRRVTSLGQAFALSEDVFLGGGLDAAAERAAALVAVTPDDVRRVAARYLSEGPLVTVVAR